MNRTLQNIIISLVLLFLLYSLSKTLLDYNKKFSFYQQYKREFQEETDRNKKLKSDLVKAQDYHTVERTIREKLNLSKPNEVVVIIPMPSVPASPTPTPTIE